MADVPSKPRGRSPLSARRAQAPCTTAARVPQRWVSAGDVPCKSQLDSVELGISRAMTAACATLARQAVLLSTGRSRAQDLESKGGAWSSSCSSSEAAEEIAAAKSTFEAASLVESHAYDIQYKVGRTEAKLVDKVGKLEAHLSRRSEQLQHCEHHLQEALLQRSAQQASSVVEPVTFDGCNLHRGLGVELHIPQQRSGPACMARKHDKRESTTDGFRCARSKLAASCTDLEAVSNTGVGGGISSVFDQPSAAKLSELESDNALLRRESQEHMLHVRNLEQQLEDVRQGKKTLLQEMQDQTQAGRSCRDELVLLKGQHAELLRRLSDAQVDQDELEFSNRILGETSKCREQEISSLKLDLQEEMRSHQVLQHELNVRSEQCDASLEHVRGAADSQIRSLHSQIVELRVESSMQANEAATAQANHKQTEKEAINLRQFAYEEENCIAALRSAVGLADTAGHAMRQSCREDSALQQECSYMKAVIDQLNCQVGDQAHQIDVQEHGSEVTSILRSKLQEEQDCAASLRAVIARAEDARRHHSSSENELLLEMAYVEAVREKLNSEAEVQAQGLSEHEQAMVLLHNRLLVEQEQAKQMSVALDAANAERAQSELHFGNDHELLEELAYAKAVKEHLSSEIDQQVCQLKGAAENEEALLMLRAQVQEDQRHIKSLRAELAGAEADNLGGMRYTACGMELEKKLLKIEAIKEKLNSELALQADELKADLMTFRKMSEEKSADTDMQRQFSFPARDGAVLDHKNIEGDFHLTGMVDRNPEDKFDSSALVDGKRGSGTYVQRTFSFSAQQCDLNMSNQLEERCKHLTAELHEQIVKNKTLTEHIGQSASAQDMENTIELAQASKQTLETEIAQLAYNLNYAQAEDHKLTDDSASLRFSFQQYEQDAESKFDAWQQEVNALRAQLESAGSEQLNTRPMSSARSLRNSQVTIDPNSIRRASASADPATRRRSSIAGKKFMNGSHYRYSHVSVMSEDDPFLNGFADVDDISDYLNESSFSSLVKEAKLEEPRKVRIDLIGDSDLSGVPDVTPLKSEIWQEPGTEADVVSMLAQTQFVDLGLPDSPRKYTKAVTVDLISHNTSEDMSQVGHRASLPDPGELGGMVNVDLFNNTLDTVSHTLTKPTTTESIVNKAVDAFAHPPRPARGRFATEPVHDEEADNAKENMQRSGLKRRTYGIGKLWKSRIATGSGFFEDDA